MARRSPPHYVPTLTHVIKPAAEPAEAAPAPPGISQEDLIARIMQRVDLELERRLREAIASIVIEETRSLGPLLRDEVESVVRDAVADAFAAELAPPAKPPR